MTRCVHSCDIDGWGCPLECIGKVPPECRLYNTEHSHFKNRRERMWRGLKTAELRVRMHCWLGSHYLEPTNSYWVILCATCWSRHFCIFFFFIWFHSNYGRKAMLLSFGRWGNRSSEKYRSTGAVQAQMAGSGGAGTQTQVYLTTESELPLKSDFLLQARCKEIIYLFISFGCFGPYLQHSGSSLWPACSGVVAWGVSCPVARGILVPLPGIKPVSPALEGRYLTTGLSGKSPLFYQCL